MSLQLPIVTINGVHNSFVSPLDRGFAYGDGLFETCRYFAGRIPLWDFHRERLLASAQRLRIALDEVRLNEYLDSLLALLRMNQIADAVVKVQLTRGVGGRGYRLPDIINPTYCIGVFAGEPLQSDFFRGGVDVRVCDLRLGKNSALAGIKHLNRLEHIMARAEWHDEFAEGLLLDTDGNVTEATVSNFFLVKGGELITPDLDAAGVAGVMRRAIIDIFAAQLNLSVKVTRLKLSDLRAADEIFLSNSVFGIWPVNSIAGMELLLRHTVTRQLQEKLLAWLRNT
ncbi:aminodeoxychorismate lyase [Cellvibrio sp. KY-GH-1]|uniref:aminodeoxychorismate lyase n=1 Tax=Cellvibrio sp. KY-GH-1 TaxID=2303332 RepID=UPI0012449CDA|nr:aminodeoxychorismate lyase [Cellvibrio sp. KY-GH-1]QEY14879.1 aminodeoxychorismate lyase [Cellvibrio sp. KY-GH-1]